MVTWSTTLNRFVHGAKDEMQLHICADEKLILGVGHMVTALMLWYFYLYPVQGAA